MSGSMTLDDVRRGLRAARYITTPRVEIALFLALTLEKPLLAEGPAGAGKTELGKVLAELLDTELVRLQCYEGLDEARALFEWNYQKQLLRIQADRAEGLTWENLSSHIFSAEFLLERPLLRDRGREEGRPADRRGGQVRPGVRGLPARGALRLPGD